MGGWWRLKNEPALEIAGKAVQCRFVHRTPAEDGAMVDVGDGQHQFLAVACAQQPVTSATACDPVSTPGPDRFYRLTARRSELDVRRGNHKPLCRGVTRTSQLVRRVRGDQGGVALTERTRVGGADNVNVADEDHNEGLGGFDVHRVRSAGQLGLMNHEKLLRP